MTTQSSTATTSPHDHANKQIRRVLLITLALNLLVAISKITLGFLTGALSIAADGFHSLSDGAGNIVGLTANRFASRPPDEDHPYGHARYETLAALLIGGLLLLTAWEVIQGTIAQLQTPHLPEVNAITFAVMIGTLIVNLFVTVYEQRAGKRWRSEILLADARHTRADVWVTMSVILSLIVVQATGWAWLDPLMALVVVALIGRTGWQIVRETGLVLVDTAPYHGDNLRHIVGDVPYVQEIVRARSRGTEEAAHVDIDVRVEAAMTAAQGETIAGIIRERLVDALQGVSEVEVHFVPNDRDMRDVALIARAHGDALGIATHEVVLDQNGCDLVLELHVEVPADLSLTDAHSLASTLENAIRGELPALTRIVTHIEPAHPAIAEAAIAEAVPVVDIAPPPDDQEGALVKEAEAILWAEFPHIGWHDLQIRQLGVGYGLTLHAALPDTISIAQAHAIAEDAEMVLRGKILELDRVTIHTEPESSTRYATQFAHTRPTTT